MTRDAARHFARVADEYDDLRGRWPLGALRAQEHRAVRELLRVSAGDRVLDVGCGGGATLAWLRAAGARPVGIDLVLPMARHACRDGIPVAVQDMEALGIRPVFDWVVCIGALEFAADPVLALRGLAACLRGDGSMVLLFPRPSALGRLYALYHRSHGVRIRLFSRSEMVRHLVAAGLRPDCVWRDCRLSTVCVARRGWEQATSPGGVG